MFRLLARSAPFLVAVFLVAACGDDTPATPTTPTPDPITEVFSGTINVNGAATHTFSSSTSGSVTATLTGIAPESSTMIGMSLGIWNGTACTTVTANDEAVQSSVIFGNATGAGQLCVRVYDVGQFTEATDYEVTVVHP